MKLQAGNPNLMRVNKTATLGSFNNNTGDKERARYRTGFIPSNKDPEAVQAQQINIWKQPVYKPDKNEYVRPGANDFLAIKSRGF